MSGKLYVVGTPIGNLSDLSPRGLETLNMVDFIAAEDTRVTLKLMNRFELKKPTVSYHEHNMRDSGARVIDRILAGENCAVVSDAGMPAISDPGQDLVALAHQNGIEVVSVPGPSAVITALAISGIECNRFCFEGFLSGVKSERRARLGEIKSEKRTMVFYEAPHKLVATLSDMLAAFGERKIAVIKELTKIHETVMHTTLSEAVEHFAATAPKGEFVLIVSGAAETEAAQMTFDEALDYARDAVADGTAPTAAAKQAAQISGFKRSEIYKALVGSKE